MANIKLTNNNWETSGIYDITQGKTQRQINSDLNGAINDKIIYFSAQTVSAATNAEILRITDSRINATTVVMEWQVVDPDNIKSSINWTSGAGYISFVGTCSAATAANVTLGNR